MWSALDLEGLALAWRRSRTELDVLACLRAMVFNRLCDPASKLGVPRWLDTVALPHGFGFDAGLPGSPGTRRIRPPPREHRLVVAHDPLVAQRRSQARREQMRELIALGQHWGGRLDDQDAGQRRRGRPLSDSGAKARLYHAVKDANLAHLIKVDLHSELFQFTVDEERLQYLERLDGKLLLVTNTDAPAEEVV